MTVLPEVLRVPNYSEILFIAVLLLSLLAVSKKFVRFLIYLVATVAVGYIFMLIMNVANTKQAADKDWATGVTGGVLKHWLFVPADRIIWGNVAFVLLLSLIAYFSIATSTVKKVLLPFITFGAVFLWEVRLIADVSTTRQLIIGVLLVVLMIIRPQGFLGKTRVEVL